MQTNYSLTPDKFEIKREMLSDYQLKNAGEFDFPIGNVQKLMPNFFDKDKCASLWKLTNLFRLRLKLKKKKICPILEFNQLQQLKPYIELNTPK